MRTVVLCAVGIVLTLPGAVRAVGEPQLVGTVGPGYYIELKDSAGNPVTTLAPGTYDILVHDLSGDHNFHLSGPGVNQSTSVGGTGDTTWQDIVFQANSTYGYLCDPHPTIMRGSFTTSALPPPPPRPIARGRWTAMLRVGTYRFKRDIRIG